MATKRKSKNEVKYQFVPAKTAGGGAHASREVVQKVGEEMLRLGAAERPVDKKELLDASRSKDAPLHDQFEWDDSIAGENYRLEQARWLIQSVKIIPLVDGEDASPVRALTSIVVERESEDDPIERGFMFMPSAMAKQNTADQVVNNALNSLETWVRIYGNYERLKSAASVVAKLIEEIRSEDVDKE